MPRESLSERLQRSGMAQYLLEGEDVIVVQRPHWAKISKPVAIALAAFLVVLALDTTVPTNLGGVVNVLWAAWLVLLAWTALQVVLWRKNWFVATDKRMLVNYGVKLVNVNLAMLSLSKVVDLSYTRSTMGFFLGYGTLVRESSGSGQTLHDVEWVKNPDETYRTICAAVFNLNDAALRLEEDQHGHRFEDGPPVHAPGLYAEYVPVEKRPSPINFRGQRDKDQNPIPGIRIQYGESRGKSRRSGTRNPELNDSLRAGAATGPTRYRRSPTEDDWVPTDTSSDEDQDLGDQDVDQSDDQGADGDDGDDGQS